MIDDELIEPAMTHPESIFKAPALIYTRGMVVQDIDTEALRTMGNML
jgi:hypothetical protein